jgi:NADH:quinone reductase (non-electrogenic)
MNSHKILVLGGGFAGLWSAVGAARMREKLGLGPQELTITLVNADAYHCIRVRNYEADLSSVRVPLDDVVGPVGVQRVEGEVTGIDLPNQRVQVTGDGGLSSLEYDRLVLALGSRLNRPNIPGLAEYAFDVDTYAGAVRLNAHIQALPRQPKSPGLYSVVIVGAGLTGIETAAEMPGKLRSVLAAAGLERDFHVVLVDHNPWIGSDMGDSARPVIEQALRDLGIETRTGVSIGSIDRSGVTLESGVVVPAATVVWCAGMRANPLTRQFPVEHDRFGRLPVDEFLKVKGVANVFAAGDVASAMMDDIHTSVMSCQHGRPMGRFAGHNVVCDLFHQPLLPLRIESYVTVLDLGPWGAVYTQGWERAVAAVGAAAKRTKQTINRHRIYPPLTSNRREILDAAEPVVQTPPEFRH